MRSRRISTSSRSVSAPSYRAAPISKPFCKARGIDTLLIAGTASNGCCESTARDAAMLNFKVIMISDASATETDDMHSMSLQFFYRVYGDVLTVDEAIAGLVATVPGHLRSA